MRLDIRYRTRFTYTVPVAESQNELRACPAHDGRQSLLHYNVTTSPSSRVASYVDFWGTRVDTFGVRLPHTHLDVLAEATVDTAVQPLITSSPRRSDLATHGMRDRFLEYLSPSRHVRWGPAVTAAAERAAEVGGDDLIATVLSVHRAIGQHLTYVTGATYVGVPIEEVLAAGRGVCQDFAHLAVAMYRSLGIPARYVSGYLFATDDATGADTDADEVEVETHAWVDVAIPLGSTDGRGKPEIAWFALDPTNQQEVGERHVAIARGRDYDDVAPFRGVYAGASEHELEVTVGMRRLAVESVASAPPPSVPAARGVQQAASQQQ